MRQTALAFLLPAKSHFRQVHLASRFGELNLVKTPYLVHLLPRSHQLPDILSPL